MKYSVELFFLIIISFIELLYGIVNIDSKVCNVANNYLPYWLIIKALVDDILIGLLFYVGLVETNFSLKILWSSYILYLSWIVTGLVLFFQQCSLERFSGAIFIIITMLVSFILSFINFQITYLIYCKKINNDGITVNLIK